MRGSKQLSKAALDARNELVLGLSKAAEEVAAAYADYSNAIADYNSVLGTARAWRDEVVSGMEFYMAERSDTWQQGDGSVYLEWQSEYWNLDLEDVDVPGELQLEHEDLIESLPDAPG